MNEMAHMPIIAAAVNSIPKSERYRKLENLGIANIAKIDHAHRHGNEITDKHADQHRPGRDNPPGQRI